MNKETLKKMGKDLENIPGIYNYCDYWCERCPFTSRCLNYKIGKHDEEELKKKGHSEDENKIFWERIHGSFQLVLEMLREDAARFDIDIDNLPDMPEVEQQIEDARQFVNNHPLTKMGEEYSFSTHEWINSITEEKLMEKKEEEFQQQFLILGDVSAVKELAAQIAEATEVISWYSFQITVKLKRALSGREQDRLDGFADDDAPKDSDGSVKVSLIGIDRSLGAWNILLQHFPEKEDVILHKLALLQRLGKAIEKAFPNARSFFRPGFDG